MSIATVLVVLAGLLCACAAAFDWNWFMEHRKAASISHLLGSRERGRVFYGLLGMFLIVMGFLQVFGVIKD